MFSIKVNDVFEELSEENKRLLNELMFANKCLKVLITFKTFVEFIACSSTPEAPIIFCLIN